MASRNLDDSRSVIGQVASNDGLVEVVQSEIALDSVRRQQEAKIIENVSNAELEVNALNNQFKIDYEGDPTNKEGLEALSQAKREVYAKNEEGISPLHLGTFRSETRKVNSKYEGHLNKWGVKQGYKNAVSSINATMENNLNQAYADGEALGTGDLDRNEILGRLMDSNKRLADYGNSNLGSETTKDLMQNYTEDYIKMTVSGLGQTSPGDAVALLDMKDIKESFGDMQQYAKLREGMVNRQRAMERRAKNDSKVSRISKGTSAVRNPSMSYDQIQTGDFSDAVKEYLLRKNGFAEYDRGSRGGLTPAGKAQMKLDVYEDIALVTREGSGATVDDYEALQERIYTAMSSRAMTDSQGLAVLNTVSEPMLELYQKNHEDLGGENIFGLDYDSGVVDDLYEDHKSEGDTEVIKASNNELKAKIYESHLNNIKEASEAAGVSLSELSEKDSGTRKSIFAKAAKETRKKTLVSQIPELADLDQIPNSVLTKNGTRISGSIGTTTNKQQGAVYDNSQIIEKNGRFARRYPDGRIVEITPTEAARGTR